MVSLQSILICWSLIVSLATSYRFAGIRQFRYFNLQLFSSGNKVGAVFFDCDGVLAETERDIHRVTFNQAFGENGLDISWNESTYGQLLKIGGGKERLTHYFDSVGWPQDISIDIRAQYVASLHRLKTENFKKFIKEKYIKPRRGVRRLLNEAIAENISVAICSTSSEEAVRVIAMSLFGSEIEAIVKIFAGDVVSMKKPAPDIYLAAAKFYNIDPARCWVVEDSEIGLQAAKYAGMHCIITKSFYTKEEDFHMADIVVDDLDSGNISLETMEKF